MEDTIKCELIGGGSIRNLYIFSNLFILLLLLLLLLLYTTHIATHAIYCCYC